MLCPKCHEKYSDNFTTCPYCSIMGDVNPLGAITSEYGGIEIFSEENQHRLNKALMALDASYGPAKDWLLLANMKRIPQKLYAILSSTQKEKQDVVDECRETLCMLILDEKVCEKIISYFTQSLKIDVIVKRRIDKIITTFTPDGLWPYDHKVCQINNKVWFAENYKGWRFNDFSGRAAENKKCGRLYQWSYLHYPPRGWRLPTIEDFQDLADYIESLNYNSGTALKAKDQWDGDAEPGLDLFGFCAYPTIRNSETGVSETWFWTSSPTDDDNYPYYCVSLTANRNDLNLLSKASTDYYACVRYVRDVES